MTNLQHRQEKMKDKRKDTLFRDFLKQIASFRTLSLYKTWWLPSIYPDTDRIGGVVWHKEFEERRDGLTKIWFNYDFSCNFFENFKEFFGGIQQPCTRLFETTENCGFSDQIVASKNCYLSYVVINDCENVLYSLSVKEKSTNILNSLLVRDTCEIVYYSIGILQSFKVFYSKYIQNSSEIYFSSNLIWCQECIFCTTLENRSYCIHNEQLSKEEYRKKKAEILQQKSNFLTRYTDLQNSWNNIPSDTVSGNFNIQCEQIEDGYYNYQLKDARNAILVWGKGPGEHVYDCFLNTPPENNYYGTFSAWYGDNIYNSYHIKWWSNVYYSSCLENSSYCLGCVWLRNKSFHIFNTEYSKEERFVMADKILEQMDRDWTLWQFFPWYLNPFYFNDTAAYLIDPSFTKEEVIAEWYLRRDGEIKVDIPSWMETVHTSELWKYEWRRDAEISLVWRQRYIDENILKKVIIDEEWNSYRIIKMEYDFLMKYGLPLPRKHWLTRMKENFKIN
jgi:hypothetical protein